MTEKEAFAVLGIGKEATQDEIKRAYRKLMHRVHPDTAAGNMTEKKESEKKDNIYQAHEINMAYQVLRKRKNPADHEEQRDKRWTEAQTVLWDAPVCDNAYTERKIFQPVHDPEGNEIGRMCVAKGRYQWTEDEEFPLFMHSIYHCSGRLLAEAETLRDRNPAKDERTRLKVQAELAYLLAQQFMGGIDTLAKLAKEIHRQADGRDVYRVLGALERTVGQKMQKTGSLLAVSGIRNHRLYVKNQSGQELGYLSFWDDRLYYVLIPLFEYRQVQVKIEVVEDSAAKSRKNREYSDKLMIQIRQSSDEKNTLPENLNLKIVALLEQYRK